MQSRGRESRSGIHIPCFSRLLSHSFPSHSHSRLCMHLCNSDCSRILLSRSPFASLVRSLIVGRQTDARAPSLAHTLTLTVMFAGTENKAKESLSLSLSLCQSFHLLSHFRCILFTDVIIITEISHFPSLLLRRRRSSRVVLFLSSILRCFHCLADSFPAAVPDCLSLFLVSSLSLSPDAAGRRERTVSQDEGLWNIR